MTNLLRTKANLLRTKTTAAYRTVMGEKEEEYLDIPNGDAGQDDWNTLTETYGEESIEAAANGKDLIDQFAFSYHPDERIQYALALNENLGSIAAMTVLITHRSEEIRAGVIRNPALDCELLAARLEAIVNGDDDSDYYAAIFRQVDNAKEGRPLEDVVIQAIENRGFDFAEEVAPYIDDYEELPRI